MSEGPSAAPEASAAGGASARPARVVDALGQACPLPVIWLAKAVTEVEVGDEVTVLADDPGAKVDIPVWCRMRRQELRAVSELPPAGPADAAGRSRPAWSFTIGKVT